MSPSTTVRRAGVVTASALALSLGGVISAGSASGLTVCPLGQILSSTGQCVKKTVDSVVTTAPKPSSGTSSGGSTSGGSSSSGGGLNVPLPTVTVPLPSGGGSTGGSSSGGSSGSGSSSGGGLQLPSLPDLGLPDLSGGGTGGTGGITGPTVPAAGGSTSASTDGSSVPGSKPAAPGTGTGGGGMLSPASAYLPTSGILGFTNFSGTGGASIPTVSNLSAVPSPLLANQPASELAAVQAPLLAAGEQAGQGGSTVLASFGGYALPGLLVVLATAVVATVGAGNVRVWQARLAARRA